MTVAKRLFLLIVISIAALLILGIGSIVAMKDTNHRLENVNENLLPSVVALESTGQSLLRLRIRVLYHILNEDPDKQAEFEKEIAKLTKDVQESFDNYGKNLVKDEADKSYLDKDIEAFKAFDAVKDQAVNMSRNLQKTDAQTLMLQSSKVSQAATQALLDHAKYNAELGTAAEKESAAAYKRTLTILIALIVLAAGAVSVIGFAIYRNVVGSLGSLRDTLTQIESSLDFTKRAPVTSRDEVGMTVEAFNRLTSRLQTSLREIAEQSDRVSSAAKQLTETAHIVTDSASSQSAAAADMAATVEEMTVSINHVADQAGEANRLSGESGELAVNGEKTIVETVEDINEIAHTVRSASEYVANLDRDSQSVNEVVGVIKEIADQTNLLALNAAIEAARAGEQGRGFAVVADEVRKLAERTSQSTQVIAETIAAMQVNAQNTVEGMKAVDDRVAVGVERANAANSAIAQIRTSSGRAVERVAEISDAIREQGIASTSIAQQVEKIAQMSEENHAAAENTSATAEELDQLAHRMKEIVSQYKI
ncbi:MAG: methyl-accepting chemotaxis protein [Rhodocyclaceae bacterium]|nr:methyl-accepting chemotaxis protein [Rhodocyclaceae bacterium]